MRRLFPLSLLAAIACATAFAQLTPKLPTADKPLVSLTLFIDEESSQQLTGSVTARIEDGWHINAAHPLDEFSIPTVLSIESAALADARFEYPPHKEEEFDFAGGKLAVYDGTIRIPFTAKKKMNSGSIEAKLRYQACNDRICLPPTNVSTRVSFGSSVVPVSSTAVPGVIAPPTAAPGTNSDVSAQPSPETVTESSGTPTIEPLVAPEPEPSQSAQFTPLENAPAGGSLFGGDVRSTFAARGLWLTLLVIFVGGLALNLTPCVYPLIPITFAFFSSQSGESRLRRFSLASSYVLGLALTYSVLGVFSALSGKLFGAWLQSTGVLVFFAVMMVVLAASMFGLYDIRVPHFITDRSGARAGYAGALSMGLLVGIVAAPCVGPFVISLIALVSQIGSPVLGFVFFFALAVGLGLPYLILAVFSSGISSIPRAGVWMDHVKKAFGFVMIAMAFYFLRPVLGELIYTRGVAASLILGALFLFVSGREATAQSGRTVRIVIAVLLLVAGSVFAWPRHEGEGLVWEKFSESALENARTGGRPVIIDFYADWCLPCKELDAKTFNDSTVLREGESFVRLKADLTRVDDPATVELSSRFGIVGVPTIVFVGPDGAEIKSLRLTGFEEADKFVVRMKSARQSSGGE